MYRTLTHFVLAVALVPLLACNRTPRASGSDIPPSFEEASQQTGLQFDHFTGATGDYYMPEIVGPGVALIDYDGDGDLDIFLVQGDFPYPDQRSQQPLFPHPGGWKPGCRLFRNELNPSGKLHFTDVTVQAGVAFQGEAMGVAVGDYDNDGHPDLFVTGYQKTTLYHNNGNGTFTDVTHAAGVEDGEWSTSAAFLDYDRDGRLDLFVTHYVNYRRLARQCHSSTGEPDYCGPQAFQPSVSRLFHNEGNGRFRDVTRESGIGSAAGPGLGVAIIDADSDGWPDIYVANDGAASYLWINQHDGTFREAGLESGVAFSMDGKPQAGMGVAVGDYDNRDFEDIFKTNLTREGSNLYHNDGRGFFADDVAARQLLQPTIPYTGFGAAWLDYDNDGWLDLAVANGAVYVEEAQRGSAYPFLQPNLLFHNLAGKRFADVSVQAGPAFQLRAVGRGLAVGDLDNDGRMDLVISNNNGAARLLLNRTNSSNHWLEVRLEGAASNRMGLGAKVGVARERGAMLWRRVRTDGSFLSAHDSRAHFGLADESQPVSVEVVWPDGKRERWTRISVDRILTLHEGTGQF